MVAFFGKFKALSKFSMHDEWSLTSVILSPSSAHRFETDIHREKETSGHVVLMVLRYVVFIFEIGHSYT